MRRVEPGKSLGNCISKKVYLTRAIAKRSARRFEAKSGEKMRPYKCPHCGMWHITHTDRRLRNGRR